MLECVSKVNISRFPVGKIDCIDLGKDFFLIRFSVKEDYDVVLKNGPWFIGENFLSIRPWEPNFKPATAVVSLVAVWVRLNELSIEYYDPEALLIIGQAIGNVLRIDTHTASGTRGRYARLCIQVDFEKPLANVVLVDNVEQPITYEGLHRFCFFFCGRISHQREECIFTIRKPSPERPATPEGTLKNDDAEVTRPCPSHEVDPKDDTYGPWMVVSRRKSSNRKDKKQDTAPTNGMHAGWREGVDVRIGPGDTARVTPGMGVSKTNDGKRKLNGDLVGLGETLKDLPRFKEGSKSFSPNKMGQFNQGPSRVYESPSSIKGKKVLARLKGVPVSSKGTETKEGNGSAKLMKAIWTPTNAASQSNIDGKFQFRSKPSDSMGGTSEGKDGSSASYRGVAHRRSGGGAEVDLPINSGECDVGQAAAVGIQSERYVRDRGEEISAGIVHCRDGVEEDGGFEALHTVNEISEEDQMEFNGGGEASASL